MEYKTIIKFVNRYGGYSLRITLNNKTVYKHNFFFVTEEEAEKKAKDIIKEMVK